MLHELGVGADALDQAGDLVASSTASSAAIRRE
jgi:hypothetical protein